MCCHSVGSGYGEPNAAINAIGYATQYSRSHDAVIRVYDAAGNIIETHEHVGDFKGWVMYQAGLARTRAREYRHFQKKLGLAAQAGHDG